jgi:hypothetical protein
VGARLSSCQERAVLQSGRHSTRGGDERWAMRRARRVWGTRLGGALGASRAEAGGSAQPLWHTARPLTFSSHSTSPRVAAPRSLAAVLCPETLQLPHAPDGGGTTTGRRWTNRHVLRHLRPADAGSCASRGGGGAPDSKTLPEYPCDPHVMQGHSQSRAAAGTPTACCVRVSCHDRCLLTLVLVYFAHRMGSV